jgi:hypothetical protein
VPSPEFLAARNRELLAQAVNGGVPLYVPRCSTCGNRRNVTRDASHPAGWSTYCNHCRRERRRENGVVPRESDAFRRKMRRARLEVLERKRRLKK